MLRVFASVPSAALIVLAVLAVPLAAQTLEVRQDGTGDFITISAALAAATPGTTVLITDDGTYVEDLVWPTVGNVTLRAADYRFPVLQPATTTPGGAHVRIPAFTFEPKMYDLTLDGTASLGDGLVLESGVFNAEFRGLNVSYYQGSGAHAIWSQGDAFNVTIAACTLVANTRGITIVRSEPAFIASCLIYNKPALLATADWGIKAVDAPSWLGIINCTVDMDATGAGILLTVDSLIGPPPPGPGGDIPGVPLQCSGFGEVYLANTICVNGAPSLTVTGPVCGLNFNCLDANDPVQGLAPNTNMYGNAMFRDRPACDFDLQAFSPCRNTASDSFLLQFRTDIEGTCRPMSGGPDVGAYEAMGGLAELDWEWSNPLLVFHLSGDPGLVGGKLAGGAASFASCPGILIPTGRFPLAFDALLAASLDPANAAFYNLHGTLSAAGELTGSIFVPPAAQPIVSGIQFYVAYAIVEPVGFFNLVTHSNAVRVSVP